MCRCGRKKALENLHTDWSDQEARQALMRRFDLVPYAAAGCQRQVSGRLRRRGVEHYESQIDGPGVLGDG